MKYFMVGKFVKYAQKAGSFVEKYSNVRYKDFDIKNVKII